ncbi:serine/threonine-protein kinase [Frankia sp. AgB32]|uniref:protein kinase domain-containing protein n=1 Tax=Frankia sp. AgB32 TaxID=631119 RepID=UPI002010AB7C|nr:serine/threonine-protein kinase [Frankia sp. AgB32]MCK9894171.1 serine/threonine protein kinase [Frankia sp. AgB32]
MTDPHTTANGGPLDNRIRLAGRYRIDGLLGSGGMSEVSYGYDERLDRQVAIKLLRPAGNPPGPPGSAERIAFEEQRAINEKRFLREIRTTASLEHPGIPAVFDTGVHTFPDGSRRVWLVMQLLRGSTVHQLIEDTDYDDAPLAIARAAGIGAQVAAVLASVHAVDVVHRDIKPDNLVLVPGGFVKVLDFGIAILRGADAPPRLTQVDHTIGTPEYMSPEQHLGSVITPASDLYSLGCLLFGLLTGERVFYLTGSGVSLRELHVKADPPRVGALRPDVPTELAELVHAMLAKDSRTRPTAVDAYQALARWAAAPPATPAGDGLDPTQPFRHPLLVVPRRTTAAGAGAWAAHPGTAVLDAAVAGIPPEAGPPAIELDRSAPAAAARLSNAAVDRLLVQVATLVDADRPAEAIDLLEAAVAAGAADPPRGLDLRRALAETLYLADRFTRAAALNDAVRADYLRYHVEPSNPWVLDCAYYAGLAYARIGAPEKALDRLRAYLDNADTAKDEPLRILEARRTAAFMLAATGRTAAALTAFKALRNALAATHGSGASGELQNLDKIIEKLGAAHHAT